MGLELLDEEVDQRGVESPCLRCLAGDVGALFGVEGFGDAVQVQAFLPDFLEDSATLLVAMKPVYFPWLRVRAVYSAVPWYASCQGKMSNVGSRQHLPCVTIG